MLGIKPAITGAALLALTTGQAAAQERAAPEDAKEMSEKAAQFLKEQGPAIAFPAFNEGAEWHDRDLYVFVVAEDGTMAAHGANRALIGENLIEMTDPTGTRLIEKIVEVDDEGWVDYQFLNPETEAIEPKQSYVIQVDDQYSVGVGAYAR